MTCTDSSTCSTCSSAYLLYMSQCLSSCPDTTYPTTDGSCQSKIEFIKGKIIIFKVVKRTAFSVQTRLLVLFVLLDMGLC